MLTYKPKGGVCRMISGGEPHVFLGVLRFRGSPRTSRPHVSRASDKPCAATGKFAAQMGERLNGIKGALCGLYEY